MKAAPATVGFRVKSGWATGVLVAGPASAPRALDRRVVELSDPAMPTSRQPYHAVMGAAGAASRRVEERLLRVVTGATERSIRELLERYRDAGHAIRAAALVVGSVIDPARIANDHIRAHALEGALFRTALATALDSQGVPCSVVVEREAYVRAAALLKRTEAQLRRAVTELGRSLDGPWRADEKTATLAAWMALQRR